MPLASLGAMSFTTRPSATLRSPRTPNSAQPWRTSDTFRESPYAALFSAASTRTAKPGSAAASLDNASMVASGLTASCTIRAAASASGRRSGLPELPAGFDAEETADCAPMTSGTAHEVDT